MTSPGATTAQRARLAARRRAVARLAARERAHLAVITRRQDVSYLSGFTGEDSWLLVGRGWARLITDGRFGEQAPQECPGIEVDVRQGVSLSAATAAAIKGRRVRRLVVQTAMPLGDHEQLSRALGSRTIVPAGGLVAGRMVKDDGELRAIVHAVRIAEKAFYQLIAGGVRDLAGKTERQIAAKLEYLMRAAGADGAAFPTIVAGGLNASRCHHSPGDRKARRGEGLLLDFGALAAGYHSDLTRVVFLGSIPPTLGRAYEAVRLAQQAGIRAVGPGVLCKRPDAVARGIITRAGFGPAFVHGLGHGLGREVHEAPGLGSKAAGRLRAGMVVTVEPGVYLPGVGGIRIEDDVVVTASGRRRLSALPTEINAMLLR